MNAGFSSSSTNAFLFFFTDLFVGGCSLFAGGA
jgi:hypothetical protein